VTDQPGPTESCGPESAPAHAGPHDPGSAAVRGARDPKHTLRYVARSDRGLVRATNQDSVFAGDRLLVIADGMGGHAAGDTASRLVVAAFAPLNDRLPAPDLLSDLVAAAREGNDAIAEVVADNPELDGMGTTVTAMLFDGARVGMAHVGDSRAYLYRAGVLHQLTHDDTFVQSLVDDGRITEDEAAHHPQRNLLLRALNGTDLDPFLALREVRAGDRYLLCSDGLSGVVDAEHIADTLGDADPERAADVLIQRALLRGGPDNVTVIVADVVDTGVAPAPGPVAVPGDADPEATGPLQQLTREMPRVPLPPIPEGPAATAEFLPADENDDGDGDLGDSLGEDFEGEDFEGEDLGEDFQDEPDDNAGRAGGHSGEHGRTDEQGEAKRAGESTVPAASGDGAEQPAARSSRSRRGGATDSGDGEHRRWHRRGALAVAIVVLIGVALAGSTLWVRSQYYVGAQNNMVAVFRGVNGSLLGFHFSTFQETSCGDRIDCTPMRVSDLQPAARNLVQAGIQASSLTDARDVMSRLSGQLLPLCPDPATPGSGTAPPTGSTTGSPNPSGSTGTGGASTPAATRTTGAATPPTGKADKTGRSSTAAGSPGTTSGGTKGTGTRATIRTTTTTTQVAPKRTATSTATGRPAGQRALSPGLGGLLTGAATPDTVAAQPTPVTRTVQTTVTPAPPGFAGDAAGLITTSATPGASSGHDTTATAATAATPTVTVTQTVTAATSATGTPLAPAPAVPGVTCRVVG